MSYRLGRQFLIDDFGYAVGRTEAIEFAIEILNRYKDISGGEIEVHNIELDQYFARKNASFEVRDSAPEPKVRGGYVYLMFSNGLYKIGISSDPMRRRKEIERASGRPVQMIAYTWARDAWSRERTLHNHFSGFRREGEWFALDQEQVDSIVEWFEEGEA